MSILNESQKGTEYINQLVYNIARSRYREVDYDFMAYLANFILSNMRSPQIMCPNEKKLMSKSEVIQLTKDFYKSIDSDIYSKIDAVLNGKDETVQLKIEETSNIPDDYNPRVYTSEEGHQNINLLFQGNIFDAYDLVHELAHTIDMANQNGWNISRIQYAEITSECIEKMFISYLRENKLCPENIIQYEESKFLERTFLSSLEFAFKYGLLDIRKQTGKLDEKDIESVFRRYNVANKRGLMTLLLESQDLHQNGKYVIAGIASEQFGQLYEQDKAGSIENFKKYIEAIKQDSREKSLDILGIDLTPEGLERTIKLLNPENMTMKKYKTISNRFGNIDLYICHTKDGQYIMGIPNSMRDNAEMFVETYNAGGRETDNYLENIQHAMSEQGNPIEKSYVDFITDFPIVVPIVPCLKGLPDLQQMSVDSVEKYKIHKKVKDCIDDAKRKIETITGKKLQDKIFLSGYSASGVFAQRFALIYPELINRALIGGAAGTIPIPTQQIKFPIGIQDYEELFDKKFNAEAYKQIQFGYYVAEKESATPGNFDINGDRITTTKQIAAPMHDMSFRSVTTPKDVGILQRQLLGKSLDERYKKSIEANKIFGVDIEGIVVSGSTHRHIHNTIETPSSKFLKDQLISFYTKHKQLNPKAEGCCENIDNSYQKAREEKDKNGQEREYL